MRLSPALLHTLCVASLLAASLLFLPGLHGAFLFDDSINIVDNPSLRLPELRYDYLIEAAFSNPASAGQRWLSMLSFALNHYWWGPTPAAYKAVNIALHALTSLAFYGFLVALSRLRRIRQETSTPVLALSIPLAGAAALWWLLSPINLSPALYVVQRMTSLAALFTWVCLMSWVLFRSALDERRHGGAAAWFSLSCLAAVGAVSSKENGVLIPLYLFLIEWALLRSALEHPAHGRWFIRMFGTLLVACLVATTAYLLLRPDWLPRAYGLRDFTPVERVMTQGRVLWFYLSQTLLPQLSQLGLHHDDWRVSRGLLSPGTTLISWLGWSLYLWAALRLRHSHPLACFGLLFFLAAHSMEASFLSLEMVHEHRNYLPSAGLIMSIVAVAGSTISRLSARWRRLVGMAALAYLCIIAGAMVLRIDTWSNAVDHALAEATHHPHSPRSQYQWGRVQLSMWEHTGDPAWLSGAHATFRRTLEQSPQNYDSLIGLISIASRNPLYQKESAHWRDVFTRDLGTRKLHPSIVSQLPIFLESCAQSAECVRQIPDINQTFLGNQHATPRFKALWLVKLAYFFSDARQDDKVEPLLKQAMIIDPGSRDVARVLGLFYLQKGKLDEAEAILTPLSKGIYGLTNPSIGYFLDSIRDLRAKAALPAP